MPVLWFLLQSVACLVYLCYSIHTLPYLFNWLEIFSTRKVVKSLNCRSNQNDLVILCKANSMISSVKFLSTSFIKYTQFILPGLRRGPCPSTALLFTRHVALGENKPNQTKSYVDKVVFHLVVNMLSIITTALLVVDKVID